MFSAMSAMVTGASNVRSEPSGKRITGMVFYRKFCCQAAGANLLKGRDFLMKRRSRAIWIGKTVLGDHGHHSLQFKEL
jgi:hypothetical protein